jgi:hypothetical protein
MLRHLQYVGFRYCSVQYLNTYFVGFGQNSQEGRVAFSRFPASCGADHLQGHQSQPPLTTDPPRRRSSCDPPSHVRRVAPLLRLRSSSADATMVA